MNSFNYAGLNVVVSDTATLLPELKQPHTDDMRAMVEVLLRTNPPERKPAMIRYGNTLYAHPMLYYQLKQQIEYQDLINETEAIWSDIRPSAARAERIRKLKEDTNGTVL